MTTEQKFIIYNRTPTLTDAQQLVGGYVETRELENGDLMVFNEDGKLKGMDLNVTASVHLTFAHPETTYRDVIVGPAGLIKKELRGNDW